MLLTNNYSAGSPFKIIFLLFIVFSSYNLSAQLVQDFKVNDDITNYDQGNAKMGVDGNGNFVIVWQDGRRGITTSNLYCQRFDSSAHRLGNNFIINSILDSAAFPYISVRKDGSFGVAWYEINSSIANSSRYKFRLFNNLGTPISSEIILNDNVAFTAPDPVSTINSDTTGNFIATLCYYGNIYYQRIDKFGNKVGVNVIINDDTGSYWQAYSDITVRQDGSFIVCWQDARPPVPYPNASDIFMQMYDSNGTKIGKNSRVNDLISIYDIEEFPFISSDTSGAFCIIFTRGDNTTNEFFGRVQFYDKFGNKIGNNLNIINGYDAFTRVIRKRKNGDMIIGFTFYNGVTMRQYNQRRKATGEIIGNVFQVSNQAIALDNWYCDAAIYNDKIINVITDYRNGNPDVYCNIRSFLNPDSLINSIHYTQNKITNEFKLYQNYPNPFNSETSIKYQIPYSANSQTSTMKLVLFDILGKEIETFVYTYQGSGVYEVKFNCSTLSTGIYFYTLLFENQRQTKTMLHIK